MREVRGKALDKAGALLIFLRRLVVLITNY